MGGVALADASFLIALLSRRDRHHRWALEQAGRVPPPWKTCEAVLSEAFYLLGRDGGRALAALLEREAVVVSFDLADNLDAVLKFMHKYANVPASLADACLVRMTETVDDPLLLTTRPRLCGLPSAWPAGRALRSSVNDSERSEVV